MKRVRTKSVSNRKRRSHQRYEQCNVGKKDAKKKDEQNEESYGRKLQNQDTKYKYLTKEQKVVLK
jgi:hypothetical protein